MYKGGRLMTSTTHALDQYQDDLRMYLVQRFGSRSLAERVLAELEVRLQDAEILASVGNPLVYLCGFGLSLGMGFVKEELRVYPSNLSGGAGDAC
jgi:hypothetical protein